MAASHPISAPARKAFARRVRAVMDEKGLSTTETVQRMRQHLPEGSGLSHASISHYRTGRAIPRPRYLDALCLALGVEASELLPLTEAGQQADGAKPSEDLQQRAFAGAPSSGHVEDPNPRSKMQPIGIDDHGDEVSLHIVLRVPWSTALAVVEALKQR